MLEREEEAVGLGALLQSPRAFLMANKAFLLLLLLLLLLLFLLLLLNLNLCPRSRARASKPRGSP